jgi:hypothetical protein
MATITKIVYRTGHRVDKIDFERSDGRTIAVGQQGGDQEDELAAFPFDRLVASFYHGYKEPRFVRFFQGSELVREIHGLEKKHRGEPNEIVVSHEDIASLGSVSRTWEELLSGSSLRGAWMEAAPPPQPRDDSGNQQWTDWSREDWKGSTWHGWLDHGGATSSAAAAAPPPSTLSSSWGERWQEGRSRHEWNDDYEWDDAYGGTQRRSTWTDADQWTRANGWGSGAWDSWGETTWREQPALEQAWSEARQDDHQEDLQDEHWVDHQDEPTTSWSNDTGRRRVTLVSAMEAGQQRDPDPGTVLAFFDSTAGSGRGRRENQHTIPRASYKSIIHHKEGETISNKATTVIDPASILYHPYLLSQCLIRDSQRPVVFCHVPIADSLLKQSGYEYVEKAWEPLASTEVPFTLVDLHNLSPDVLYGQTPKEEDMACAAYIKEQLKGFTGMIYTKAGLHATSAKQDRRQAFSNSIVRAMLYKAPPENPNAVVIFLCGGWNAVNKQHADRDVEIAMELSNATTWAEWQRSLLRCMCVSHPPERALVSILREDNFAEFHRELPGAGPWVIRPWTPDNEVPLKDAQLIVNANLSPHLSQSQRDRRCWLAIVQFGLRNVHRLGGPWVLLASEKFTQMTDTEWQRLEAFCNATNAPAVWAHQGLTVDAEQKDTFTTLNGIALSKGSTSDFTKRRRPLDNWDFLLVVRQSFLAFFASLFIHNEASWSTYELLIAASETGLLVTFDPHQNGEQEEVAKNASTLATDTLWDLSEELHNFWFSQLDVDGTYKPPLKQPRAVVKRSRSPSSQSESSSSKRRRGGR